ncbi:sensor histidine kinase [Enterocloster clostridioformis]|uniref:sensor histidine kinase n=1 Tax=Enterocloster clostridioformis TaxID=1531 RepID=UPI0008F195A1|nr:HAMP domain-containing sensor histidine kinase [Enterocloster clostridioformis]SFG46738.1 Signal transduction histidine kinase [Enterocloster clostridioformis]
MKKSGYKTIFHIYLIFFLSLLGTVILAGFLFFLTFMVTKPDGTIARSDWPKTFTEDFAEHIVFIDSEPQVKQAGMELLWNNKTGIQILDCSGHEVFGYQKPELADKRYTSTELLRLSQTGKSENGDVTAFVGMVSNDGKDYTYILYPPVDVSKLTMYVNGEHFDGGKNIILPIVFVLFLAILLSGVLYGLWTTRAMKRLMVSIQEISIRSYFPVKDHGVFQDLYNSLNELDAEIKTSDRLRGQTEKMREEWIANITHDLKTPLSPIKGYAEVLKEDGVKSQERCRRYAAVILKNAAYMENLINDLKLTYQLENGMFPINRQEQDAVRFLKELVIDILNTPEYENRMVHFENKEPAILYSFDSTLLTRAFRNLIINAFVHGEENTEVILEIKRTGTSLQIRVSDNGKGMTAEEIEHLFDRYYRGTNTEQKTEGTGLGLAIAKSIVELHGGSIAASGIPGMGTTFQIDFPSC